jgi:hypothetical protein
VRLKLTTIAVDQTGVFLGMREAVRVMRKQKIGLARQHLIDLGERRR